MLNFAIYNQFSKSNASNIENCKFKNSGFTPYHFFSKSGKGFTLIEVLVSLLLIGAMLLSFQAVFLGTPLAKATKQKEVALTVAKNEMRELRAGGYGILPSTGSFSDPLLGDLDSGAGTVTVTAYNATTKQVVVSVAWSERGAPQSVALTTLITQAGGLP